MTPREEQELQSLIVGLDMQDPRWWQNYASQEEWRQYAGQVLDPWRKPMTDRDAQEAISKMKRVIAQGLMIAVRAALDAGLVVRVTKEVAE